MGRLKNTDGLGRCTTYDWDADEYVSAVERTTLFPLIVDDNNEFTDENWTYDNNWVDPESNSFYTDDKV